MYVRILSIAVSDKQSIVMVPLKDNIVFVWVLLLDRTTRLLYNSSVLYSMLDVYQVYYMLDAQCF